MIQAPISIGWSERSAGQEAQTAAMLEMQDDSFDAQFRELDYDSDIEDQLAALKHRSRPRRRFRLRSTKTPRIESLVVTISSRRFQLGSF